MNPVCREILGVDQDADITGLTDSDLVDDDVAEQFREDDKRVLDEEQTIEFEEEVPTPDGTQTRLTLKSPLFDDAGDTVGICAVSTDISERTLRDGTVDKNRRRFEALFDDPQSWSDCSTRTGHSVTSTTLLWSTSTVTVRMSSTRHSGRHRGGHRR
jgi:PAS domain S-box-containing protein